MANSANLANCYLLRISCARWWSMKNLCRCNLAGKSTSCLQKPGGESRLSKEEIYFRCWGAMRRLFSVSSTLPPKNVSFSSAHCVLHGSGSVVGRPWSVLSVLSCPVCQVNLRPLLWARGQQLPGHRAREEGQGAPPRAGEGALWVWTEKQLRMAGLGFHFLLHSPGASFTGTDSWRLKVSYPNRVFRLWQG